MRTKEGHRTAHVKVQLVEDSPRRIVMFFDEEDKGPLTFTPEERPSHFKKLLEIIESQA